MYDIGLYKTLDHTTRECRYPVLLKATGGGGGIGIYICNSRDEVVEMFPVAARQGQANFGDAGTIYPSHKAEPEVRLVMLCRLC